MQPSLFKTFSSCHVRVQEVATQQAAGSQIASGYLKSTPPRHLPSEYRSRFRAAVRRQLTHSQSLAGYTLPPTRFITFHNEL